MKRLHYRKRQSGTAKWLKSLPIRLTCSTMSENEVVLLKERVFYALRNTQSDTQNDLAISDLINGKEQADAA